MRVNELLALPTHRVVAAGTAVALLGLTGCDAFKPPEACSVTIAPQAITVSVNNATPVVGTAFDCKGNSLSNKKVSFSSNNNLVATVTPDGQVIGVAVGQTQISAVANGKSASAQVTVTPEAVQTVTVTPNPVVLRVTNIRQFTAVAKNSRGDIITGRAFEWASSNSSIASVDGSGMVTAHAPGSVQIMATSDDNRSGTASVQVTAVPIGMCTLTPASRKITINEQFQPTLLLRDTAENVLSNTGRDMTWGSDNEVTATVNQSGTVTARKAGTAKITAAVPNNPAITCDMSIEVVPPRIVTVVIQQNNPIVRISVPKQLTVQMLDSVNQVIPPPRNITWRSLDPSRATVSNNGVVTGTSLGSARIEVDAEGAKDTVTAQVTRIPVGRLTLSPAQRTVTQGATTTFTATVEDSIGNTVTDREIEWSSSDPARASVDETGKVTAFGTGTVTITATSEGKSDQSQLIIQQIPADTIVVALTTVSFVEKTTGNSFSYTVRDANGTQLLGRTVTVSSDRPDFARVVGGASTVSSGTVNVDALKPGTAVFTLQALNSLNQPEGKVTRVTVTITAAPSS